MTRKKIDRSGVLPYYIDDGKIKILFMKPSDSKYGGDSFQMAKGKAEKGETPKETAMREGSEELGLYKGNVEHNHELGVFLGRTTVFVPKIKDPDAFGDPHFETEETKWMTPEEFYNSGRELHYPVVKAAVRYIEEKEDM